MKSYDGTAGFKGVEEFSACVTVCILSLCLVRDPRLSEGISSLDLRRENIPDRCSELGWGVGLLRTIPLCYSCFQFRALLTGRTTEHSTNRTFPPTATVLEAGFDFEWGSDDLKFTLVCFLGGERGVGSFWIVYRLNFTKHHPLRINGC